MLTTRLVLSCRTARTSSRGGFTLVELLVVIGIIAILAGVALGPITNGIHQAQHNGAMQTGRQIGQLCFAYQTDTSAYPAGATGLAIAQLLINANYASDPGLFGVSAQPGLNATKPTVTATAVTLDKSNVSWSFTVTALNTGGGLTTSASDLIPLVYFNNGFGVAPANTPFPASPGTAKSIGLYTSAAPFGNDGTAVFYKGNNAAYLKAGTGGTVGQVENFISGNCQDTTTYVIAP